METEQSVPTSSSSEPQLISLDDNSSSTALPAPTAANNDTPPVSIIGNPAAASSPPENQSTSTPMQESNSQSRHANVDPDDMDDSPDYADLHADDPTISQASVSYVDVIKPGESRAVMLNRLRFYLTSSFPVTFKSIRCRGPADARLVIVTFKSLDDDESASEFSTLLSADHVDLKMVCVLWFLPTLGQGQKLLLTLLTAPIWSGRRNKFHGTPIADYVPLPAFKCYV